uniref:Arginine and serine rich coiled-coil 1 n=1 Tax=Apteryx owenii TaxID=8824 RepID=A0A8B9Q5J9_APTOW
MQAVCCDQSFTFSALEIRVCCQGDKSLKMGRRSSDTEEENRSRRKKKHRRRSSSSSSSDSRTYTRKKSGRKSRSRSRSRDLQSRSHSYEKRRRHRSSSSSSYGSRRKRSRSRSRGRGKSYRSQRSRSKSRTRRSRSRPRQRSYSRSSERSGHRRTHSGSRERERRKGREKEKVREKEKGKGKEKEIYGAKLGEPGNIKAGLEHLTPAEQAKARLQLVLEAAVPTDSHDGLHCAVTPHPRHRVTEMYRLRASALSPAHTADSIFGPGHDGDGNFSSLLCYVGRSAGFLKRLPHCSLKTWTSLGLPGIRLENDSPFLRLTLGQIGHCQQRLSVTLNA